MTLWQRAQRLFVVLFFALAWGVSPSLADAQESDPLASNVVAETTTGLAEEAALAVETDAEQAQSFWLTVITHPFVALFAIIALGYVLGAVKIAGISLGSSGVVFVALVYGHYGFTIPDGIGTLGLIFFIYAVGLSAGPTFFRAFAKQGADLAVMAVLIVVVAAGSTIVMATLFDIPTQLAAGIMAGSMTSTPALAAALDGFPNGGALVPVGYGIAYPFGVIGVVLFVQLLPRLLGKDLDAEAKKLDQAAAGDRRIDTALVEVTNHKLLGRTIWDDDFVALVRCRVTRVRVDGRLEPLRETTTYASGQILRIVGEASSLPQLIEHLGARYEGPDASALAYQSDSSQLIVTSRKLAGRTLGDLRVLRDHGVLVTRITRDGMPFVPTRDTAIHLGDELKVVGDSDDVGEFATQIGHTARALNQTDLLSLAVGIALGLAVGMTPVSIGGGAEFSLGLSGGLLLVSLLLGHLGHVGPIVGRVPQAAQVLLMELGLVFFLAHAGIEAGASFVAIIQQHGALLFLAGVVTTALPLLLGYLYATYVQKANLLQALGGICGGMTSTPALGAIKSKTDSSLPVISYAGAYPVSLILMLFAAKAVIGVLGMG